MNDDQEREPNLREEDRERISQLQDNVSNATNNPNVDQTQNIEATIQSGDCDKVIEEAQALAKEIDKNLNNRQKEIDDNAPSTQHNKSGTLQGAVEQNSYNGARLGKQLSLIPYREKLKSRLENLNKQIDKMIECKEIIDNPMKSDEEKELARSDFDTAKNNYKKIDKEVNFEKKNPNLAYFLRGVKDAANIIDNMFAYPVSAIGSLVTGQNGNKFSEYFRLSNIAQGSGQLMKKAGQGIYNAGQGIYNRITPQRRQDDNAQQQPAQRGQVNNDEERTNNTRPRSPS